MSIAFTLTIIRTTRQRNNNKPDTFKRLVIDESQKPTYYPIIIKPDRKSKKRRRRCRIYKKKTLNKINIETDKCAKIQIHSDAAC